jgi:hypothetical protein
MVVYRNAFSGDFRHANPAQIDECLSSWAVPPSLPVFVPLLRLGRQIVVRAWTEEELMDAGGVAPARRDDFEHLRLHVEAVWSLQLPGLAPGRAITLPGERAATWAVYVARVADGLVTLVRADLPAERYEGLRARALSVLDAPPGEASAGITREVALRLGAPATLGEPFAESIARPLTAEDRDLVERFQAGEAAYYLNEPTRRPVVGVVIGGQLVSVAHSARRTTEACELGIDTMPEARRRGFALAATLVWTRAVTGEGLVPLYSALAENRASLALAHAAGYRPFAHAAYIDE